MTNLDRRPIFDLKDRRQPTVVFFTSSLPKFLQAKIVFDRVGLRLAPRKHADDPYRESYAGSKEQLLTEAVAELHRRGGATGSFFFIEDTSIRIEALSLHDSDQPGLGAKEWFARTQFEDLNRVLDDKGDRRATVKSCIALAVPGLGRPIFFYGETEGVVAPKPAAFDPNPFYPWLSPDNFSAWLIPDGVRSTLSEMSFESSLRHDFRVKALAGLVDRLEEYTVVLNANPPMYYRPHLAAPSQPTLFRLKHRPVILVVGPTCSGKTTFGAYVQQNLAWDVIDASSVVRTMREERNLKDEDIADFAHHLLEEEGPDVVARTISANFGDSSSSEGLVVTGFRTIEEIEFFREEHQEVQVISVEAPERVRYERYLRRATRGKLNTFDEFKRYDRRQHELGLLPVAAELANVRVSNIYDLETYYVQVARVLGEESAHVSGITRVASRLDPERSQLYRCLVILRDAGRPLTTQEIERDFGNAVHVRYNNANKILKRYPQLAKRREGRGANVRYQITPQGLAFLGAIDRLRRVAT
jgi:dephospho-CoA kinase/inosine/xanthosine triphosphate pyrophosphatase family protein